MQTKIIWRLARLSALEWYRDSIPRYSASLAYYTFFSLAPLIIICVAISGIFFGAAAAQGRIYDELAAYMGPEAASAVQALVKGAWQPGRGLRAVGLGVLVLVVGAVGVLNELKCALNLIWGVKGPRSVRVMVLNQTKLIGFLLGIGFLLVVSLLFSALLAALGQFFGAWLPWPEGALVALDLLFEWGMIIFAFAAIFKWLPDSKITWRDVWIGSAVTSLLFLAGKTLLGFYLGRRGLGSVYGAAGSLIVILVWVYYSALIFYFGAEFTKVYANLYGSHVAGRLGRLSDLSRTLRIIK